MYPFTTSTPRLITRSPSSTTIEYTVTTAPIPPTSPVKRFLLLACSAVVKFLVVGVWIVLGLAKYRDEDIQGGELGPGEGEWVWIWYRMGKWSSEWIDWGGEGSMVLRCAKGMEWWWIGVGLGMGGWWAGRRGYTEESLLILRNLGIQTRTCPSSTFSPLFLLSPVLTLVSPVTTFLCTSIFSLLSASFTKLFPNTPPPLLPGLTGTRGKEWFAGLGGTTRFIPTSQIQDVWIHEGFVGFEVRFFLGVVVRGEEEIVVVFPRTLPGRRVLEVVWRGLRGCLYEKEEGMGMGHGRQVEGR